MGMDVYGIAPSAPEGEYFRNNIWWWRPLWDYVEAAIPDIAVRVESPHTNDGTGLNSDDALELSTRLMEEVSNGRTKRYETIYMEELNALPEEVCSFCEGNKKVLVQPGWYDYVDGVDTYRDPCNACNGKGTTKPFQAHYPFSTENVVEFATFLRYCGGFEIC
jgi:hypothetical protein